MHKSVVLETLELRRLLSYAAGDYFPLAAGNTWHYDGTFDGDIATQATTTAADTVGGKKVTRFDSAIAHTGGDPETTASYYSLDAEGLKLHEMVNNSTGTEATLAFATPLLIMKTQANVGDVTTSLPVATTVTINDPDQG